jgi:hypothetical protein
MRKGLFSRLYRRAQQEVIHPYRARNKQKIFCIGRNKTGTTSLTKAMLDLGYTVGSERKGEQLIRFYKDRNFKPIIEHCKSAEFFQDVPFSWPYTFMAVDAAFPGSKFILTVRDSSEQWYSSWIKHHSRLFAHKNLPTSEELQNAIYCYKGWLWEANQILYDMPEDDPFRKDVLIRHYEAHNSTVLDYFKYRPDDLLVLNLAEEGSYGKLCKFLNREPVYEKMPWKNKS